MYPAYLEENIHLVEDKRVRRLIEAIPRLGEDEKTALLRHYHPDYNATSMRKLRVGVNKGDATPIELADLLEGVLDSFDLLCANLPYIPRNERAVC